MQKKVLNLVGLILLSLFVVGCSKGKTNEQSAEEFNPDYYDVFQVSSPDEVYKAMSSFIELDDISKYIDETTEIDSSDRLAISYALGSQAANATLAQLTNSPESEALINSIKDLAVQLNIRSSVLEALLVKLSKDVEIEDTDERNRIVRNDLRMIISEIEKTLESVGNINEATMIKLGGWVESVRVVSSVLEDNYDADITSFLNRSREINYFLPKIRRMEKKGNTYPVRFISAMDELRDVMENINDHKYTKEDVARMNEISVSLADVAKMKEVLNEN